MFILDYHVCNNVALPVCLFHQQGSVKDRVYALYMFFAQYSDEEVSSKAITGLGKLKVLLKSVICVTEVQQAIF